MTTRQFILSCKRFKPENFAEMNVPLASSISFQSNLFYQRQSGKVHSTKVYVVLCVMSLNSECTKLVHFCLKMYQKLSNILYHICCTQKWMQNVYFKKVHKKVHKMGTKICPSLKWDTKVSGFCLTGYSYFISDSSIFFARFPRTFAKDRRVLKHEKRVSSHRISTKLQGRDITLKHIGSRHILPFSKIEHHLL